MSTEKRNLRGKHFGKFLKTPVYLFATVKSWIETDLKVNIPNGLSSFAYIVFSRLPESSRR